MFVSFQPTSFTGNISRLQAALDSNADLMTSNLLCLNSAKDASFFFGLKPQLNIRNPTFFLSGGHSVHPTASARNLGFIVDCHYFLFRSHLFCLSCMFLPHP